MKIDRMLGIITFLLQTEKTTAAELSTKFEVSKRTILRDIDNIGQAGIPIITLQGGGGGIAIAEGYKLDKSILSTMELQSIITGLKSIENVSDSQQVERLIDKLSLNRQGGPVVESSVHIDLASHYKPTLSEKIALFKNGIKEKRLIQFDYYSEKGRAVRRVEPYQVTYKWGEWYALGFCTLRKDFRLFKLNRLWNYFILEDHFIPREVPLNELERNAFFTDEKKVTLIMDSSVEYLLVESYGPNSYIIQEDGNLEVTLGYTKKDFIISWILSFGDKARVVGPKEIMNEIREIIDNMKKQYF